MKLISVDLEKKALQSICSSKSKIQSHLLGNLRVDHFAYPLTKEVFKRISFLVKHKNEVPEWSDILNDPSLEEETRKVLKSSKKKLCKNRKTAVKLVRQLDDYRRSRTLYYMAENVIKTLEGSSVDISSLIEEATDGVHKARLKNAENEKVVSFQKKSSIKIVKRVLKGKTYNFMPTGIKSFDATNMGWPQTGLVVLAGTTGGGKSTLAQTIANNMAVRGVKTCYVPLEMDEDEMTQRQLAHLSKMSLSKIIDPKQMSPNEKKEVLISYKQFNKKLLRVGGSLDFVVPEEDLTAEELLYSLKPKGYQMIVIDYISLLAGVDGDDQWRALSNVARFSKIFAKQNKVCIVLLAQLSEQGALRYSKGIKEHANVMWHWIYDDTSFMTNIVMIEQDKCRMGKRFKFPLHVDFDTMTFRDLSQSEKDEYEAVLSKKPKQTSGFSKKSNKQLKEDDAYLES